MSVLASRIEARRIELRSLEAAKQQEDDAFRRGMDENSARHAASHERICGLTPDSPADEIEATIRQAMDAWRGNIRHAGLATLPGIAARTRLPEELVVEVATEVANGKSGDQ